MSQVSTVDVDDIGQNPEGCVKSNALSSTSDYGSDGDIADLGD